MYQYCFSSAGRGNGRGAMSFLMSFALEPEIVTLPGLTMLLCSSRSPFMQLKGQPNAGMALGGRHRDDPASLLGPPRLNSASADWPKVVRAWAGRLTRR